MIEIPLFIGALGYELMKNRGKTANAQRQQPNNALAKEQANLRNRALAAPVTTK